MGSYSRVGDNRGYIGGYSFTGALNVVTAVFSCSTGDNMGSYSRVGDNRGYIGGYSFTGALNVVTAVFSCSTFVADTQNCADFVWLWFTMRWLEHR